MMKKGLCSSKCPRCNKEENWCHVVKCKETQHVKESHIAKLGVALRKVAKTEEDTQIAEMVKVDTRKHLGIERSGEYITTQYVIRMKHIFRG